MSYIELTREVRHKNPRVEPIAPELADETEHSDGSCMSDPITNPKEMVEVREEGPNAGASPVVSSSSSVSDASLEQEDEAYHLP